MHGRLFGIEEGRVSGVLYGYLGVLRIFVIVFRVVSHLSLLIAYPNKATARPADSLSPLGSRLKCPSQWRGFQVEIFP
jgi:hypothetical protein